MKPNKIEIIITEGNHYCESVKGGTPYTSVDYSASRYGGASPCDNEEEIKSSIGNLLRYLNIKVKGKIQQLLAVIKLIGKLESEHGRSGEKNAPCIASILKHFS